MREEFGWQHKTSKRVADWSPLPPAPRPVAPWRHLPAVVLAAALFGAVAGVMLIHSDQQRRARLSSWTDPAETQGAPIGLNPPSAEQYGSEQIKLHGQRIKRPGQ